MNLNTISPRIAPRFAAKVNTPTTPQAQELPTGLSPETKAPSVGLASPYSLGAIGSIGIRFGARPPYEGPYEEVKIITDYGVGRTEGISNSEVKDRFFRVLDFVTKSLDRKKLIDQAKRGPSKYFGLGPKDYVDKLKVEQEPIPGGQWAPWSTGSRYIIQGNSLKADRGTLEIDSVSDIPGGNVNYISLGLLRLGGAEPNQKIFIHVVDPGVGVTDANQHDRSILVSKEHGVYVGPNNGSLGLLAKRLTQEGDTPQLLQIDFKAVQDLERLRLKNPSYKIPATIHGRDLFAVVAGAIAGGLEPSFFGVKNTDGSLKTLEVVDTPFTTPSSLPAQPGETVSVQALQDKTFGNLKLHLPLTDDEFEALRASKAQFEVKVPTASGEGLWQPLPVGTKFSDVPVGEVILYHGSSPGTTPGTRNLEIALNLANAADHFKVDARGISPIEIRRKAAE